MSESIPEPQPASQQQRGTGTQIRKCGGRQVWLPGHHCRMGDKVIRCVPFAGALNFRDIGGYPVASGGITRWRAVYRSDSLHYLTNGDLAAFDALGVKAIYDLRRPGEIASFPGPRDYVRLEIPNGDLAKSAASLQTRRDGEAWLAADYL